MLLHDCTELRWEACELAAESGGFRNEPRENCGYNIRGHVRGGLGCNILTGQGSSFRTECAFCAKARTKAGKTTKACKAPGVPEAVRKTGNE